MALATLSIDIMAKLASFEAGMDKAARIAAKAADDVQQRWDRLGTGLATAGGALGAVLGSAALSTIARDVINGLDALNDLKDATGASIENLSALEDVALRTGTSMETVGSAVVKMNKVLAEADPGSATANIIKQLGLDAEALRREDPAEALRQLAVALSGFEDNANKARIVQELFGKSIKEVAPLLNDLAEKSRLVGTVTGEQAAEAEKFNKQLAQMEKNALDAKRALANELLPTLNQYLLLATQLSRGPGLLSSLAEVFRGNTFTDAGKALAFYSGELAKVDKQIKALQSDNPRSIYDRTKGVNDGEIAKLQADRERLAAFANVYRNVVNDGGAGAGRGSVSPLPGKPSLGSPAKKDEKPAEIKDTAKAYETLIAKIEQRQALALIEVQTGEKATEADRLRIEVLKELAKAENLGKITPEESDRVKTALAAAEAVLQVVDAQTALRNRLTETARLEAQATEQLGREAEARIANNLQLRDEIAAYGLSAEQLEALNIQRLQAAAAMERETLLGRIAAGAKADELTERSAIILALDEEIRLRKALFERRSQDARNPLAGATRALADYQDEISRTGESTYSLVRQGVDGLEDRLATFFTKGKADWRGYFTQIAIEAAKVNLIRPGLNSLINIGLGFLSGGVGITGANTGGKGLVDLGLGAGRAYGGDVGPRELRPVLELGRPELLDTPDGTFLLTGRSGGHVRALGKSSGVQTSAGQAVNVTMVNNGTPKDVVAQRRMSDSEVMLMVDDRIAAASRSTLSTVRSEIRDPNGGIRRDIASVFRVQRGDNR